MNASLIKKSNVERLDMEQFKVIFLRAFMTCSLVLPKIYPLCLVCLASQRSNKVFVPFAFIKTSLSQRKHIFINNKRKTFCQFVSYFVV